MMEVILIAESADKVSEVSEQAIAELKERLWKDVWRDNIDIPQAEVSVEREGDCFRVTARVR